MLITKFLNLNIGFKTLIYSVLLHSILLGVIVFSSDLPLQKKFDITVPTSEVNVDLIEEKPENQIITQAFKPADLLPQTPLFIKKLPLDAENSHKKAIVNNKIKNRMEIDQRKTGKILQDGTNKPNNKLALNKKEVLIPKSPFKFKSTGEQPVSHVAFPIKSHIQKFWRLPTIYRKQENLSVTLSLKIDTLGKIVRQNILNSSGNKHFDHQALEALMQAEPFPTNGQEVQILITFSPKGLGQ